MKMLIEKNVLMEGLNYVSKALSTRNIIPILNGIKFDLKKEGLALTATDNDITIQSFISKEKIKNIEEIGCIIIYGKSLLEIIRKLPNTDIYVENFENKEVSFKTENANYNFNCFMQEDFPNVKFEEVKKPIILSSLRFKEIINQTSFACSLQESRPLLTGVNIKLIGNIFECVATDSYRLSKVSIILDKVFDESINIVIPARNINELVKTIESDSELEIHIFSNKVIFKHDNLIFQSS
ncbi:MAG: DNA polymerase III subunit beta, partial [Tenericutes bacterium]|nr:DNA polymerase III subunit beta [Mycoplasmatota bacterium]